MYPIIDTPQDQTSSPSDLFVIQRLDAAAGSCYLVETSRCNYTKKIFLIKIMVAREHYISFIYFLISVHSRMSGREPRAGASFSVQVIMSIFVVYLYFIKYEKPAKVL